LIPAFRSGFWNIGAEGQFIAGAIAGTWVSVSLKSPLTVPLALALGFVSGVSWLLVPAILKIKMGVNEIISTLMMNYIAVYLLLYVVLGPLSDRTAPGYQIFPTSALLDVTVRLPRLIAGTRVHLGVIIAILSAIGVAIIMMRTSVGFQMRATGASLRAARYAGIRTNRSILIAVVISGGLAGLTGAVEVLGIDYRLFPNISAGVGYVSIIVAFLGNLHPIGVILAAIFVGILDVGITEMKRALLLPTAVLFAFEGMLILFLLVGQYASEIVKIRRWLSKEHDKIGD
jgi:simple sugar transport system permease protein